MGFNLERANKEIEREMRRMFREDVKMILGFFGLKVKEN
jgi:hypothetical protein